MSARAIRIRAARPSLTRTPAQEEADRRRALRSLLTTPLLVEERADPEDWAAIRRDAEWLRDWFADKAGWQFAFDGRAGIARLRKQSGWANADPTRGATAPGAGQRPMDRRSYVLFCLACAELDRTPGLQTLVSTLADQVATRSAAEGLRRFDRDAYADRFALVDALRLLEQEGVLRLTDGDADRFVEASGDVLYTVNRDRLSRLVAAPRVPSAASGIADLLREAYPDTADGRARRTRHRVMRRLLDDPVVYDADLDPDEAAYARQQRRVIAGWLREAGLELERRAEGMAAIDPTGELSDETFPSGGTFGHAALLFAEFLAERGRGGLRDDEVVAREELVRVARVLIAENRGRWRSSVAEADGPDQVVDEALARLEAFRLVRRRAGGVSPRPAIARFRSTEINALAGVREQLSFALGEDRTHGA